MMQHVGASVLVSPWWRAASEGDVRHEASKDYDIRLCLVSRGRDC